MAQDRIQLLYNIECRQQEQQQQDLATGQQSSQLASQAIDNFYSQRIEQLDFQRAEKEVPIDFLKLFRQRTHYKHLGISLNLLDLLYMENYCCKWSKRYDSPTSARSGLFRHQDNCTQTESHLPSKFEEKQRIEGGFRVGSINSPLFRDCKTVKPPPKNNYNSQAYYDNMLTEANQNTKPDNRRLKKKPCSARYTESSSTDIICACRCCDINHPEQDHEQDHEQQQEQDHEQEPVQKQELDQRKATATSDWLTVHCSSTNGHCSINCKHCDTNAMTPTTRLSHRHRNESEDEIQSYELRRTSMVINLPNKVAEQSNTLHDVEHRPRPVDTVKTLLSPRAFRCRTKQSMSSSCVIGCKTKITPTAAQSLTSICSELPASSADTLNDLWLNPDACKASRSRVHHWSIDIQHVGWEGSAHLDAAGKRAALMRCVKCAALHRKLNQSQRSQGIVSRLQQLRRYQQKSDRQYHRSLLASDAFKKRNQTMRQRSVGGQLHECPMRAPGCSRVTSEMLLAHFLAVHLSEPRLALNEVGNSDQLLIKFKPMVFNISHNVCLSMIAYAREGATNLSVCNMGLESEYVQHCRHFPLFVLACRIRLAEEQRGQERGEQHELTASCVSGEEIGENVLALWMVGLEMPEPLHVHMAVFNYRLDIIRSAIVPVRGLRKCHNPERFLTKSKNYMRLNGHDLHLLTENYNEPMYLELTLRDYALLGSPAAK